MQIAAFRGRRRVAERDGLEVARGHAVQHRRSSFGEALGRVSTFEKVRNSASTDRRRHFLGNLSHAQKARCGDLHRAEGIRVVGVEAAGNQHEVRVELTRNRCEQARQDSDVLVVSAARWHGDVHRRASAAVDPRLTRGARAWVERKLMGRQIEHRGVIFKAVLAAIPVMNIPVDDQNLFNSACLLKCPRGYRDAVEETEAHRVIRFGVVPGWAQSRKARIELAQGDFCS